ncbi:MAG: hypothetical protein ACKO8H_07860, partial [Microcystis panniformis]
DCLVVSMPSFFLVWIVTDPTLISIDYYGWLLSRSTTQNFSFVSDLLDVSFVIDELEATRGNSVPSYTIFLIL